MDQIEERNLLRFGMEGVVDYNYCGGGGVPVPDFAPSIFPLVRLLHRSLSARSVLYTCVYASNSSRLVVIDCMMSDGVDVRTVPITFVVLSPCLLPPVEIHSPWTSDSSSYGQRGSIPFNRNLILALG
jgi:hypothetical protein